MSITAEAVPNGKVINAVDVADIRSIEIPRPEIRQARLALQGVSPLIVHRWSNKSRKAMSDKQTGKAPQQKSARDPEQEWRDAAYVVPGREDWADWEPGKYSMPASAFKHAFLYGVAQIGDTKKLPKTNATGYVFIDEDPVLDFESVSLREDTGRIGQGTTTMVYRPQFNNWSVDITISYNARAITLEQVVAIFDLGGFAGGVGEWRPTSPKNKSGSFGRFHVSSVTEL